MFTRVLDDLQPKNGFRPHFGDRRMINLQRFDLLREIGGVSVDVDYVADVQRCEVLAEPVASLVGVLAELLTGMARRASIPQIEVALSDGERVRHDADTLFP